MRCIVKARCFIRAVYDMLLLILVRAWTKQEGPLKQDTVLWYEDFMLHSERMLSVLFRRR